MTLTSNLVYSNKGNPAVVQFLDQADQKILDVGCGSGDTGSLIRSLYPSVYIAGITCSKLEYEQANQKLDVCYCLDIEREKLSQFSQGEFDVLLLMHVLEHLIDPVAVIEKLLPYLKIGGKVIIGLPNIANWRDRWKLTLGKFEYTDGGVMDKTHLHFYTFYTAPKYLIDPIPQLKLAYHSVTGSVPLAFLRSHLLTNNLRHKIDEWGCQNMPNLFGNEIIMYANRIK